MRGLAIAVSFLTRIPVRTQVTREQEVAGSAPWFPVVGLILGVATAAVYVMAAALFGPALAGALSVVAGVAATGAFHEDGLADTFDGLGGGATAERRLDIMKDSRLGTFGTVALVTSLGLQVLAIADIDRAAVPATLVGAHVLSRTVALGVMATSRPAGIGGLGTTYLAHLRRPAATVGVVAGALGGGAVLALVSPWWSAALIPAGLAGLAVGSWSHRRIGGVTGDVLGAVQQSAFVAILLFAAALGGSS